MELNNNVYNFKELNIPNYFYVKSYNFNNDDNFNKKIESLKKELSLDSIVTVSQQHTNIIKRVHIKNIEKMDVADGMITNLKNVGLAIKTADCQAVYLYDPKKQVIGCIHSGWRGTVKKILEKAIDIMNNEYKCNNEDIEAYICPSIGRCHFEVDKDVYLEFKNSFQEFDIDNYTLYKNDINKYYIDAEKINKDFLLKLGLKKVITSNICSYCDCNIHSYRREGINSGRNLAIIYL